MRSGYSTRWGVAQTRRNLLPSTEFYAGMATLFSLRNLRFVRTVTVTLSITEVRTTMGVCMMARTRCLTTWGLSSFEMWVVLMHSLPWIVAIVVHISWKKVGETSNLKTVTDSYTDGFSVVPVVSSMTTFGTVTRTLVN